LCFITYFTGFSVFFCYFSINLSLDLVMIFYFFFLFSLLSIFGLRCTFVMIGLALDQIEEIWTKKDNFGSNLKTFCVLDNSYGLWTSPIINVTWHYEVNLKLIIFKTYLEKKNSIKIVKEIFQTELTKNKVFIYCILWKLWIISLF